MPSSRGVSPIIATILLVAITVVLAAVLYVLVSGYLSPAPGATVGIGWGTVAVNSKGSNHWYNATVESVNPNNFRWNDITSITVKTANGGPYQGTLGPIVAFVASGGNATYVAGSGWTYASPATSGTAIHPGDLITVDLLTSNAGGSVYFDPSSSFTGTAVLDLPS